jgi:hypothetical protein
VAFLSDLLESSRQMNADAWTCLSDSTRLLFNHNGGKHEKT